MQKNVKRLLSKACAVSLALSLLAPVALDGTSAEAKAKPKFTKKSVSVKEKKTVKLKIKGVKAKKIKKTTWSVNKKGKKIVKLSGKKKTQVTVKGLKAGTAKVYAKVKPKKGKAYKKITATVKVKKASATASPKASASSGTTSASPSTKASASAVAVSITLDKTEMELRFDKTAQLTATVTGTTAAVAWSSSDTTVVTVNDSGLVKAVDAGSAVITASVAGKSATCNVTAIKPEVNDVILEDTFEDGTIKYMSARIGDEVLSVVDGGQDDGKCLLVSGRTSVARGALLNLTDICEPGATYQFTAWAKTGESKTPPALTALILSSQTQVTEESEASYRNHLGVGSNSSTVSKNTAKQIGTNIQEWTKFEYEFTAPDEMYDFGLYFETYQDKVCDIYVDDVSLKLVNRVDRDYNLPSLAETYSEYFDHIGVGTGRTEIMGSLSSEFIQSQFDSVTPGNEMKPDAILGSYQAMETITLAEAQALGYHIPAGYADQADNKVDGEVVLPKLSFENVDKFIERVHALGLKLRFHTLVWHEQTPGEFFMKNFSSTASADNAVSQEVMDQRLEYYIWNVMDHVLATDKKLSGGNGSIFYAVDVVNEYFHSRNAANNAKPTFYETIYGSVNTNPSYVKLAFEQAKEALERNNRTDIELAYNDFNTYDSGVADNIVEMAKWLNSGDKTLCDVVGMQSHLSMNGPTPDKYNDDALEIFLKNGLDVQITELDITRNVDNPSQTEEAQAERYAEIIQKLLDANEKSGQIDEETSVARGKVTGLILWSLYDGNSWRASGEPCVFNGAFSAKPAFWSLINLIDPVQG